MFRNKNELFGKTVYTRTVCAKRLMKALLGQNGSFDLLTQKVIRPEVLSKQPTSLRQMMWIKSTSGNGLGLNPVESS